MPRKTSDLSTELTQMPWWVSIILAVVCYVSLTYLFPAITTNSPILNGFANGVKVIAPHLSLILLIPVPFSIVNRNRKKRLLVTKKSLDKIKLLDWSSFEELVGEAFRHNGYTVEDNTVKGADGGIDLWLHKEGSLYIAQCKHWKKQKVNVSIVREMYGLMTAEAAVGVFVITSGQFTQDALKFAEGKPLNLVNGNDLLSLIEGIETNSELTDVNADINPVSNTCPRCGSSLVKRTAKKGQYAGQEFWGCSSFPKCRYTKNSAD